MGTLTQRIHLFDVSQEEAERALSSKAKLDADPERFRAGLAEANC